MKPTPYLIGIAGPSGAGKSYLAEHIVLELPTAAIIPIDAYYRDLAHLTLPERERLNFDDPNMLETPLLFSQIEALRRGESIQQPVYNFDRHTRSPDTREVVPTDYIIVEGLFTLYWQKLRSLLHTRVYVDMHDAVCFKRRMARDVRDRGRTPEYVEQQFRESVIPMAERYVRPTADFADVRIFADKNIEEEVAAVLTHVRMNS